MRFLEPKKLLLARDYKENILDSAIYRARKVPREAALRKVPRKQNSGGPVFVITYDPWLPPIGSLQAKHYRSMTSRDTYLKEVFKRPPLIAFKRQQNLRELLVRARVARKETPYPTRQQRGMKKCGTACTACPHILEAKSVKINGIPWNINRNFNCKSYNVVYAIICKKDRCKQTYIGETKRMVKYRLDEHRGYVNNLVDTATGSHYTLPGHSLADLELIVLEQTRYKNDSNRKEREEYYIRKFNTVHNGLNRKI